MLYPAILSSQRQLTKRASQAELAPMTTGTTQTNRQREPQSEHTSQHRYTPRTEDLPQQTEVNHARGHKQQKDAPSQLDINFHNRPPM